MFFDSLPGEKGGPREGDFLFAGARKITDANVRLLP